MILGKALSFLKSAVGDGEIYGAYHFSQGHVWSGDTTVVAVVPTDIKASFSVPHRELDLALARLTAATVTFEDNYLICKSGRARATIATRELELELPQPAGDLVKIDENWKVILDSLASVLDEESAADWMTALISIPEGTAAVGCSGAFFAISDTPLFPGTAALIPKVGATLLAAKDPPDKAMLSRNSMSFLWDDGKMFRTQLFNGEVPSVFNKRLMGAQVGDSAWEIDPEWKEAMIRVCAVVGSKGIVSFDAKGITGDSGNLNIEDATAAPIPQPYKATAAAMKLMLDRATHIRFDKNMIFWKGPLLRGIMGIRA